MFFLQTKSLILQLLLMISFGSFVLGGCTEQAERGSISTASVNIYGTGGDSDDVLTVDFGRKVSANTIDLTNIYLVPTNLAGFLSVIEPFDRLKCHPLNRIPGDPSLTIDGRAIEFAGVQLACGLEYAVCISDDILFEDGARFEGGTIVFQARPCVPELRISQSSTVLDRGTGVYDFGDLLENQGGSWIDFTATNIGPDLLTIDNLSITGSGASAFELEALTVNELDANESASFRIRFSPTAGQEYSATLSLESDDPNGVYTFNLNGTGLDDPAPTVLSVGSPTPNGNYKEGDQILITVNFSVPVDVSGSPRLQVETGSPDQWATYLSGSGSTTLLFRYIIQAGDTSSDLDYTLTSALSLNGGDIESINNVDALLTLPLPGTSGSLGAAKSLVVDTIAPQALSVNSTTPDDLFEIGRNIEVRVSFAESVIVSGSPRILLETGSVDRYATFVSGSGSSVLVFNYSVQANDFSADLDYVSSSALELNGGSIVDTAGNALILSLPAPGSAGSLGANRAFVVDGVIPFVQSVNSLTPDGLYGLDSTIIIQVNFSEVVNISGFPRLQLETGTTDRLVSYVSGSGTSSLIFLYTVQSGDLSSDLDYISNSALTLNGGTIRDVAGNAAALGLPVPGTADSLGSNKTLEVDGVLPQVLSVNSSTTNGSYIIGDAISIQVNFSEPVSVSGLPTLTLETGSTDQIAIFTSGSGTSTLTFSYTVQEGDLSGDLDYTTTTALDLAGASILDSATNSANLLLPSPGGAGSLGSNKALLIDGVVPQVSLLTSSVSNGTFATGVGLPIQVQFSEPVFVTGVPQLTLQTGMTNQIVSFTSGSGSTTLVFQYTIQPGDESSDLDVVASTSLDLNSGLIRDAAGNNASITLPNPGAASSLSFNKNLVIDGIIPTLLSVNSSSVDRTYYIGEVITISVNFSETVVVNTSGGTPQLLLETGAVDRSAIFSSGSGTSTLFFLYTVQAGDSSDDLDYQSVSALSTSGGTIRDVAGNNATFSLAAPGTANSLGDNKSLVIDGVRPSVLDVSSVASDGLYGAGSQIDITVQFTEPVLTTGVPTLNLETGTIDRSASMVSGSGSDTLVFRYWVSVGDQSLDLEYLNTSALELSGGLIRDAAGNNAILTLPIPGASGSLSANKNLEIDALDPRVISVSSSAPNGYYGVGAEISIEVNFDEIVEVTGNPQLTLETGSIDRVINYTSGDGSTSLIFSYTVQEGDVSSDLDYVSISALALNSGSIVDRQSNAAVLTLPSPGIAGSLGANRNLVIDGVAPLLFSMTPTSSTLSVMPGNVVVTMDSGLSAASVEEADLDLSDSSCTGLSTSASHTEGSATINFTLVGEELCEPGSTIVARFTPSSVSDLAGNAGSGVITTRTYTLASTIPQIQSFLPGSSTFGTSFPTLVLTFVEPINPASLTSGDIVLTGSCSGVSVDSITADPGDAVFNITLSGTELCADLESFNVDFTAADVQNLDGAPGEDTVSFTYTRDAIGPSVVSSTPATEFSDSLDLVLEFSEPVIDVQTSDFDVTDTGPACSVAPSVSAANALGDLVTLEFLGTCPAGSAMTLSILVTQMEDAYGNPGDPDVSYLYTWAASFMMAGLQAPQSALFDYELSFDSVSNRWSLEWESQGGRRQVQLWDPQSLLSSAVDVEQDVLGAIWIVPRQRELRAVGFDPSVLKDGAELNLRWPSWSVSFDDYLETKSAIMGR